MSLYSSSFLDRVAVTIDNSSGASSVDVQFDIPQDLEPFWNAIDSSGHELRLVHANGRTLLDYDVTGFNKSNRTATVQIDALGCDATASMVLAWLYFNTTSTQGDGTTAVTIASAVDAYIEQAGPSQHDVLFQPGRPGLPRPLSVISKPTSDQVNVWFRLDHKLERRTRPFAGGRAYEEPWFATMSVVDSVAADQSSMYTATALRFLERRRGGRRELWLKTRVSSGTNGDPFTILPSIRTVVPTANAVYRRITPSLGMQVRNQLQTT